MALDRPSEAQLVEGLVGTDALPQHLVLLAMEVDLVEGLIHFFDVLTLHRFQEWCD